MKYSDIVKVKFNKEKNDVSLSIAVNEDIVITRKVSVDQFRLMVGQMQSTLEEVDNK